MGERLDELARVVATPGVEAQGALWAVATDLVTLTGRTVPVEFPDPPIPPLDGADRRSRPTPWDGQPLPRPAAGVDRMYERGWDPDHDWQVTVRTVRKGRPSGSARPLWLRGHRASEHLEWRSAYAWTDAWGVPRSENVHRLATDLLADSLDRPRGLIAARHRPGLLARHFTGDVLWPLGDTAWQLTRSEIINWLDLHRYLQPAEP